MTDHMPSPTPGPEVSPEVASARAYHDLFVDALTGPWAPVVADTAAIGPGQRVLDVACGTGALTREAARRVGPDGHVIGLDPGAGMLAVARELSPELAWHEGGAESLPFEDGVFDAVVCQFGCMFFEDRVAALSEMRRVLAPGGQLVFAVWDALETMPAYAREVELLERLGGRAAADALRGPFVLGDRGVLARLCEQAGAGSAEISARQGWADFPSIGALVEADLRGWLPRMGIQLTEERIAEILAAAEDELSDFATADGRARFEVAAQLVTLR